MQGTSLATILNSERFSRLAGIAGFALVLFFASLFLIWRPYSVPGPMMRDFEAYYAAGATWAAGGDPYSTQIWNVERTVPGVDAARTEVLPFLGPPISLPFWAFLARFPFDVAAKLWGGVLGIAVVVIFLGSFRLAGRRLHWSDAVVVVTLSAAFSPLSYGFSLGQAALVATAAMIAALWLVRFTQWPWSALASWCAIVLKPNVTFVLLGLLRSRRGFFSLASAAAVFALTNLVIAGGPNGIVRYVHALRGHTLAERWSFIQITPASIAYGLGLPGPWASMVGTIVTVVAIVVLMVVIHRTRASEIESAALACAALPFVSPFLHEHDLVVLILPVMLCVHRTRGLLWAVGAIGAVFVATDWVAMTQGKIGGAYDFLVAIIVALELVALSPHIRRPYRFAPFAVAVWALVVWAAAPSSGIPLWPGGLPPGFTVHLDQPVSSVWAAEQVAAGLERVDPFAAVVRSFSLLGCGLVWCALGLALARREPAWGRFGPSEVASQVRPERRQRDARIPAQVDR